MVDGIPVAVTVGGRADGTVRVWELATSTLLSQQPRESLVGQTTFPSIACAVVDGAPVTITSAPHDDTVWVWDLATGTPFGQPLTGHTRVVTEVACGVVDGNPVAVTADIGTVRVWDLATGTLLTPILTGHTSEVASIACAVVDGTPVVITAYVRDNAVWVWDLAAGTPFGQPLTGCTSRVEGVAGVACAVVDGVPVAVTAGRADGTVRVWDLASGTLLRQFPAGHQYLVGHRERAGAHAGLSGVACAMVDGVPAAVTASRAGTVRVWDLATGTPLTPFLTGHTGEITSVACAVVDGTPVAITSAPPDDTVRVWNLRTGKPAGFLAAPGARAVALTAEGDLIVGMGKDIAAFRRRPAYPPLNSSQQHTYG
ncbi:hypothetical protein [Streptomyces sp. GESEQ-35]|uniref:hypothetical protein n=1 Tax=Streptomyces sp. GESEQ-35 TaxID=2812657 RepID=UPI001FF16182|nr:hypothetical protein [Streptomyces sp. GESEQ-35]